MSDDVLKDIYNKQSPLTEDDLELLIEDEELLIPDDEVSDDFSLDFLDNESEENEDGDDDLLSVFKQQEDEPIKIDRFDFLIDNELNPKKEMSDEDAELELRKLISKPRAGIITADEIDADDEDNFEFDYTPPEEETSGFDLTSSIPNIPATEINEYILIRGIYSKAFKEFISCEDVIKSGDFPVAIDYEGNEIIFKKINPEPKVLFHLKYALKAFEILYVKDSKYQPLDIYSLMDKSKITV